MHRIPRALLLCLLLCIPGTALAQGYICAEGGGNAGKGQWADEVFGWMVEKGGRGHVVLIGTRALEEDNRPALFTRMGAASVASLVLDRAAADTQATYDAITAARIIFIRGGAQDTYVRNWKDTQTQRAVIQVYKNGGVIAGTSAGLAVLGQVVYDALHGSLSPAEALADARHENLSLTTGFLDLVPGVLFDSHFTERARLGRLPVMLAHCQFDPELKNILGIGVDPRTAVCIGPDQIAEIRGEGTATFLSLSPDSSLVVCKGRPPAVTDVQYTQLCAGYRYDLASRRILSRPEGIAPRDAAPPAARPPTIPITLDASFLTPDSGGAISWRADGDDAWLRDGITLAPGRNILSGIAATTLAWKAGGLANQIAGLQLALAENPGLVGLWIPETISAHADPDRRITAIAPSPGPPHSLLVLDARRATHAGRGPGPRRAPALEGATLHLLPPTWSINLTTGTVEPPPPATTLTPLIKP